MSTDQIHRVRILLDSFVERSDRQDEPSWYTVNDHMFLDVEFFPRIFEILDAPAGPRRVQMSRQRPWRAEHPEAVIVAMIESDWRGQQVTFEYDMTPALAVELYRQRFIHDAGEIREALAGRDLACWCPLNQPCHADVLLEIANS